MPNLHKIYKQDIKIRNKNLPEIALIKLAKTGNRSAQEQLLLRHHKFIFSVTNRFLNRGLEKQELISAANLGLIRAIHKYDFSKNVKFLSYAVWWILQAIKEDLNNSHVIHLPYNKMMEFKKHDRDLLDKFRNLTKLDSFENSDFIGHVNGISKNLEKEDLRKIIKSAINKLEHWEIDLITKYAGLDGQNYTYEELGRDLNLSKERIRQKLNKIKVKLSDSLKKNDVLIYDEM